MLRARAALFALFATTSIVACGGASHVAPVGPPPEYEEPDAPVPVSPASAAPASPSASAPLPSQRPAA